MKSFIKNLGLVAGGVVLGALVLRNRQLQAENDALYEMMADEDECCGCCPCDPCADCDGCDGCCAMGESPACEPDAEPAGMPVEDAPAAEPEA